jgi:hypothetical protein
MNVIMGLLLVMIVNPHAKIFGIFLTTKILNR